VQKKENHPFKILTAAAKKWEYQSSNNWHWGDTIMTLDVLIGQDRKIYVKPAIEDLRLMIAKIQNQNPKSIANGQ
jgi:hypothetical protein